jgi:hypothetical protein
MENSPQLNGQEMENMLVFPFSYHNAKQIEVIRKSRKKPYLLGLVAKDSAKVLVGEYTASLTTKQKTIVCELVAA